MSKGPQGRLTLKDAQKSGRNLEELVEQLRELTVDVDNENTKVRVFCE